MLIELTQCSFGYGGRAVVRADSLCLAPGRCLGVFGPNGSGKTTLVRGVTGLLPPLTGTVTRIDALRFGYLPQHRSMELQWPMSGLDAAALALSARRRFGWVGASGASLLPAMKILGVDSLANRPFAKLSGGQQQRLLLAGALAADPRVLVLDEPADGLDVRSRQVLLDVLAASAGKGLATVMISHDVQDLMLLCDSIAWVHPSPVDGEESHVEIIDPAALAERVLATRRPSP